MLRLLSSKIFREDLSEFALPMWAFEDFEDVKRKIDITNNTYKFCLPVSIGDFAETNVPACFSNNEDELREFVRIQSEVNYRKAFIISDFKVSDMKNICFSGIINTDSKKGLTNYLNKSTTISITLKNPILTYGQEGISPRDLPADVELYYENVSNPSCAFPKINIKKDNFNLDRYKDIIYQAYLASVKMHEVSERYDGEEYSEYALFFVDDKNKIWLYEIIGEESFLGRANYDEKLLKDELNLVSQ